MVITLSGCDERTDAHDHFSDLFAQVCIEQAPQFRINMRFVLSLFQPPHVHAGDPQIAIQLSTMPKGFTSCT
jgi:hypothetical protein